MATSEFLVRVPDLEDGSRDYNWKISAEWLAGALSDTDATPGDQPGEIQAQFIKQGSEIVVHGKISASVIMPCARTLDPVSIQITSDILLMLSPGSEPTAKKKPKRRRKNSEGKKDTAAESEDLELEESEAARDHYQGEQVVLDSFIREFLLLELPAFPLRSDLPPLPTTGNGPPPEDEAPKLDPRLAPLQAIAEKMRKDSEK